MEWSSMAVQVRAAKHTSSKPLSSSMQLAARGLPEAAKQTTATASSQAKNAFDSQGLTLGKKMHQGFSSNYASRQQDIASLLSRLQVLQDRGSQFAQNLQLRSQF